MGVPSRHVLAYSGLLGEESWPGYVVKRDSEEATGMQLFYALARFVKVLLATAICLLFLRAIFWPTPLDLIVLLLLFIVFATMFIGAP